MDSNVRAVLGAAGADPTKKLSLDEIYERYPELRPSEIEVRNQEFIDTLRLESEQDVEAAFDKFIEWFYADEN